MLRGVLTIIPALLLWGTTVLLFLIVCGGGSNKPVLNNLYWSRANTTGIEGASFPITRWTNYGICNEVNNRNVGCTSHVPAYPYSPKDNFGDSTSLPHSFSSDRDSYFYLSRIGYSFWLISLTFSVVALPFVTMAICMAKFQIATAVLSGLSFLFAITASCLMTGAHVKGRQAFHGAGRGASLGVKMFALSWATVTLLLVIFIWMTCGALFVKGIGNLRRKRWSHSRYPDSEVDQSFKTRYPDSDSESNIRMNLADGVYAPAGVPPTQEYVVASPTKSKGMNFFKLNRNRKSTMESDGPMGLAQAAEAYSTTPTQ